MRNLIGYLNQALRLFFSLIFIFLLTSKQISAQSDEVESSDSTYYTIDVDKSLKAIISHSLTTEAEDTVSIKYYRIKIPFNNIENISIKEGTQEFSFSKTPRSSATEVVVDLENRSLSSNKPLLLTVRFEVQNFFDGSNSINLPVGISDNVKAVYVKSALSLGSPNYVYASNFKMSEKDPWYEITVISPARSSLDIIYSERIYLDFSVTKQLANPGTESVTYNIPFPIYNERQHVVISDINFSPDKVYNDNQGNTILQKTLKPGETLKAEISGSLIINPKVLLNNSTQLAQNTEGNGYWSIKQLENISDITKEIDSRTDIKFTDFNFNTASDEQIDQLASLIFDYISTLNIKISNDSLIRFTPDEILADQKSTLTSENYADLHIAIFRLYGIPTRAVVGYYQNSSKEFKESFIHTWVEYYKPTSGWSIFDPVLANITNTQSEQIQNSLDHIPFLYRGTSPLHPILTLLSNDKISVTINENSVPEISSFSNQITQKVVLDVQDQSNPRAINIEVSNTGNTPISKVTVLFDSEVFSLLEDDELLFPNQTLTRDIDITKYLKSEYVDGDYDFDIIIKTEDLSGSSESSISNINVKMIGYWWWHYLIYSLSLLLFSAVVLGIIKIRKFIMLKK